MLWGVIWESSKVSQFWSEQQFGAREFHTGEDIQREGWPKTVKHLIPELGNACRVFLQSAKKARRFWKLPQGQPEILTFPTDFVKQIISMLMRCIRPRDWKGEVWVDSLCTSNETSPFQFLGTLPIYIMSFYIGVHPVSNPIPSLSCDSLSKSWILFWQNVLWSWLLK